MSPSLSARQQWLRAQPGIGLSAFQRQVLRDAQEAAREARRAAPKHKPDKLTRGMRQRPHAGAWSGSSAGTSGSAPWMRIARRLLTK